MAIYLPEEFSVDGYDLSIEGDSNANFQQLMDNKLFRWMLAYPFSWIERKHKAKSRNALELIQGNLGNLLDLTQQEFDEKHGDSRYEFDAGEFRRYKKDFLQTISQTTIPQVVAALEAEDLLSAQVIPRTIMSNMREMDFTMGDLMDNNKTQRMATAKKTEQGFNPGLPHGAREEGKTAGLMGAFLESRPILYEEIRRHIKVKGHEITFNTEEYLSQLSEAEGFGKLDDSEFVIASARKSSAIEKTVEIFSISKTNDDRYRIEGFGRTRTVDDIEEAWDVYRNATDIDKLEKHIEDTILSQKKSPLSDILYSVVEPEDRMLDVGKLEIKIDQLSQGDKGRAGFGKTEPISKKSWINWVRALEGKTSETNPDVTKIENLLMQAFNLFTRDEPFSALDESKQMQKVHEMKDGILDDLTSEDLYDIWEDNGKPDGSDLNKIDDLANAIWRHALGKDMARGEKGEIGYAVKKAREFKLGPIGGDGKHSGGGDAYPVLDAGKKKRGMVQLRVSFTPTKLVSARSYEIYHKRTDEKGKPMKDLGRRPLGGKGPTTARAMDGQGQKDKDKDFKTLMELKLGYNRLKGLAN